MGLYQRAFIHKSYLKRPDHINKLNNVILADKPDNCIPLKSKSNERLEFLGDGVLELVAKYYLYRRFPKEEEEFMTNKKIAIVKNEAIGKLAYEMGLHKWCIISKHSEEKRQRFSPKKLGCLFEAFIGALFLDFNKVVVKDEESWFQNTFVTGPGFQMAQKFIESIFEKHIDWVSLIQTDDNYKNLLQKKIQKEFKLTPYYDIINHSIETGFFTGVYLVVGMPVHSLIHDQAIPINNMPTFSQMQSHIKEHGQIFVYLGGGKHKIKRNAEQIACKNALRILDPMSI
jgi:dsRNA-specific ribonuclease